MKILVINSARKFIGEAAHCLALASQLRDRGHEAVIAVRRGYELEARALQAGLPVLPLAMCSRFSPCTDVRDIVMLRRCLRENGFDLVHCHRGKDHWLAAMTGARLVRTRHVVVPMATHVLNRWLLCQRTARIIAVSHKAAESLGAMLPCLGHKLSVIYSAVDTARFSPSRRNSDWRRDHGMLADRPLVGLIARIQNIKGQRIFLEAALKVLQAVPDARFILAGPGTEHKLSVLRNRIASAGLSAFVTVRGWCEDIETAIASLDCAVVASLGSEGSSRITLEYMASGVPVVATRVGGIPEILEDGKTGLLVPPGDSGALAQGIVRILTDRFAAAKMAQNALECVRERYTHQRWMDEILAVYESVIAEVQK